jgi:cytochrome c553
MSFALVGAACFAACSDDGDDVDSGDAGSPGVSGGEGGSTSAGGKTGGKSGSTSTAGSPDETGGAGGAPPVVEGPCDVDDGQCIFRFDTFGDEQLWTDTLGLNEVVQTLTPTVALGTLGLKVDSEMVPAAVLASADLEDPATTVALLELGAVVGVQATVEDGMVTRIGITCALCHSTVDDSVMAGIGARLDGHPNRQLDPGAIIAATPGVGALAESLDIPVATLTEVLNSWGPGKYDARTNQDGMSNPVWIPPAYGLADVALETYTGEGPISYWNAYVAVTQMGAQGTFIDEELGISIEADPDLVTPKLDALREYQFSLLPPEPAAGSFVAAAATRGEALFTGDAMCSTCHAGDSFTDAPMLHEPAETGMEPVEASRSPTGMYRTTPLRGVSSHPPFFHDGSAATLEAVVTHYNTTLDLGLTPPQQSDLVEYLKSL